MSHLVPSEAGIDTGKGGPRRGLLRFLTCGSVDDGKSTLIGRLLYDSRLIMDDQLSTLRKDTVVHGTTGSEEIDFALLVDGLEAERQQGITIDVAYRFFTTARRSFIVADTPGHEQYTRNMATGASNSQVAVILIDARKGVLVQTKRHATICSLLGIRDVILAVNKIDLVDWSKDVFDRIVSDFMAFATHLDFERIVPIPLSARFGDNVTARSGNMSWYGGESLIEVLETMDVHDHAREAPFRFPVQWVNRPNLDFRGFSGTVISGSIRPGDEIVVAGSGKTAHVARIVTFDGDLDVAHKGDAVTLTLDAEIDIARGDVLAFPQTRPEVSDQMAAHIIWMGEEPLLPGRSYLMRLGHSWTPTTVSSIRHRLDVNTLQEHAARTLAMTEIAFANLSLARPIAVDPYADNPEAGSFILVDRFTNATVAAGMVAFSLRRATNIHREDLAIDKPARASRLGQTPAVIWFTGLSGSGKSTIARAVEKALQAEGRATYMLDGDNLRHGLNRDLGFTDADRVENIRRVGEVAKLMVDAGMVVLCSFISPFIAERRMVRDMLEEGEFIQVFVDTPLEVCMERDRKGLYAKAKAGQIRNFTGIDSPYERPEQPDIHLETVGRSVEELAGEVLAVALGRTAPK